MRIAIVTHNVIKGDGQGRANYEVASHALRLGLPVTLLADRVDQDLLDGGATWIPIQPKTLRKVNVFKVREFAQMANRWLAQHENEFDIIHGSGYCLDRPHHINTSQFVHGAWRRSPVHIARGQKNLNGAYQWTYSYLNAIWEKRTYANAKIVVAVSGTIERELQEIGVPADRIRLIHNGADIKEFYPGPGDRAAYNLPEGVPMALFAGDIRTPRKNLDTVLKAVARVPGLHLAVVGRVEGSPFPALAESLGIADRVHFLDFRRDIAAVMRAVDLFVFPSRYEACALVLAEALAAGLPVITARSTGGAELVTPDAGIQLNDANDVDAVAAALSRLMASPEERASMSRAARREAEQNSWDIIARSYLDLYHEVAGLPAATAAQTPAPTATAAAAA